MDFINADRIRDVRTYENSPLYPSMLPTGIDPAPSVYRAHVNTHIFFDFDLGWSRNSAQQLQWFPTGITTFCTAA